jgi:hypothetical protein
MFIKCSQHFHFIFSAPTAGKVAMANSLPNDARAAVRTTRWLASPSYSKASIAEALISAVNVASDEEDRMKQKTDILQTG